MIIVFASIFIFLSLEYQEYKDKKTRNRETTMPSLKPKSVRYATLKKRVAFECDILQNIILPTKI